MLLIFRPRMLAWSIRQMELVAITGADPMVTPNQVQSAVAVVRSAYMRSEMACASRWRHIFMTCGKNESTVSTEAAVPI
jgi:hypothetical protein